jgi:hypothetical protein
MPNSNKKNSQPALRRPWWLAGVILLLLLLAAGTWLISQGFASAVTEAPEAAQVLALQSQMPFQVMIPAYLPAEFDRTKAEVRIDQGGPSGEPMAQIAYHTANGASLFLKQWVPGNPTMEILAGSRPIQTKWGKGWLLSQGDSLLALWVDVGPTRVSVYTSNVDILKRELILAIAESLGPASNKVVFTFVVETPSIRNVPPPSPVEVNINEQGVQELTLVVTPGGYNPVRFSVKKGVPFRLIFRQLGQVGCGNELIFPTDPQNGAALRLKGEQDQQVLEFTPQVTGDYYFHCSHAMYRGVMTVRP